MPDLGEGGKKDGVETRWNEDGKKPLEMHRHAGHLEGTFTTWNDDGTLEHVSNYHEDQLIP